MLFDADHGVPINRLKAKLKRLFISGTFDLGVEEEKIDEIIMLLAGSAMLWSSIALRNTQNRDSGSGPWSKRRRWG